MKHRLKMNNRISLNKESVLTIVALALLVLAHVAVLLAILWSWRYYAIYPSLFGSAVAIVICLMIIIDIVFFIGFNHRDMLLKIVSSLMAVLLLIGGTVGSVAIAKANGIVNNVLDDGKDKYETYSGLFVCYDKYNQFSSIDDLNGKRVGMLMETTNGITYIATELLSKEKIDYATVDYKTNAEMMQGLLDNDVDAIVITSAYRTIYGNDENSSFGPYLEKLIDFQPFEQELKIESTKTKKNLNTDPFNVLLIGYSRTDIGSSVGLADSIILATINPQTYTVSMMSIARDSFVKIPCYGGEYDKINSGRSTSRACFIETVEEFLGMDIDYYMELDYLGLVQIVNAIGGVRITNPVEFELDGILVPAGTYVADGQMALQFCRERHHMPNGDFDRQQHQKEVIIGIAKKFIQSGDITLALNAMDAASDWMSTDMTLSQLTNVFNLLLNTRNYTSLDTFSLVDFQTLRITGYGGIMYYSYSMRLPLWVYLIYKGSYDESISHLKEVMGEYATVAQDRTFEFSSLNPYVRPAFYSTDYDNEFLFTPPPMPPYWANLVGLTQAEAMQWASANGVTLTISVISPGDKNYDPSQEGLVVEQSVRYGDLISEKPSGSITVMGIGQIDEDKQLPNFVGSNFMKAVRWARNHGVRYEVVFKSDVSGEVGTVTSQSPSPYTAIENIDVLKIVVKNGKYTVKFSTDHGSAPNDITTTTEDSFEGNYITFPTLSDMTESDGFTYEFQGWYTAKEGGDRVYDTGDVSGNTTVYAHWKRICEHVWGEWIVDSEPTCTAKGHRHRVCSRCGEAEEEDIGALGHDWVEIERVAATCDADGYVKYRCSVCGEEKTETLPKLSGSACSTGSGGTGETGEGNGG